MANLAGASRASSSTCAPNSSSSATGSSPVAARKETRRLLERLLSSATGWSKAPWRSPAHAAAKGRITGRASSTRLSTLLIGIVFLLSVFVLAQFFLSQEITGKDTALRRLETRIAELTDLLALERTQRRASEEDVGLLQSTLQRSESDRPDCKA